MRRVHNIWLLIAYLVFVVYGSLVPFEYRDRTFDQALEAFANIRYLNLDVVSRADWIANIVLYVPLAFLACTWIAGRASSATVKLFAVFTAFVLCISVAVLVEFTQIFFAPRTVSLNDLLAETLGTVGGIILWVFSRRQIAAWTRSFVEGGRQSVMAAIALYVIAYITLAMFPYDFVVTADELAWKLSSDDLGWLIAGGCTSPVRCIARLVGEAVAIAPLGLLIALATRRLNYYRLIIAGVLIGLALELVQLFLASGISQGLSLPTRGAGLVAGAALGRALQHYGPIPVARLIWRVVILAVLPYFMALAAVNGWFSHPRVSVDVALSRLPDVRLMPFYYHYFSSESKAMASLLAQLVMYGPMGIAVWARFTMLSKRSAITLPIAVLAALAVAFTIEFGKLWVPPKHPDPTSLLIAIAAAGVAYSMACWIEAVLTGVGPRTPVARAAASITAAPIRRSPRTSTHPIGMLVSGGAALVLLAGFLNYPAGTPLLLVGLVSYGALLYRHPMIWLLILPALLPALDLSAITGRLLLDEFDLLVLVTLTVGYWRLYALPARPWPDKLLPVAVALLWTTWTVATMRGLWPVWETDGGLFTASSHSPLEAWQVGKGLLWALLLVPLLRRITSRTDQGAPRLVLGGLVTGLALVTLVVLWERHVYVGITDFENVFRVTGTFSSMHTGGAYIEAFIAFAFPVLVVWVISQRHWALRTLGVVVVAATSYAMMVTFSRGGYAGLMVGLMIVGIGALYQRADLRMRLGLAVIGLGAVAITAALPVLSGGFAQYRLARVADDLSFRLAHWARAIDIMDGDLAAGLVGMGFGRYPTLYLYSADRKRAPGTYSVVNEGGNAFLRLGAGETVYLDQRVNLKPGESYRLEAKVRQLGSAASLALPICEKALLYSFACVEPSLQLINTGAAWNTVAAEISTGKLGSGGNWPHRPVKLSMHNPGSSHVVDVDDVSLKAHDGRELLVNGDFNSGAKRWLFVTDQDIAWHIHQQAVEIYFSQGLLGLAALALLVFAAGRTLWPAFRAGDAYAVAMAGALVAFLTVGLLGSTMDTARLSMLFYFGALAGTLLANRRDPAQPTTVWATNSGMQ